MGWIDVKNYVTNIADRRGGKAKEIAHLDSTRYELEQIEKGLNKGTMSSSEARKKIEAKFGSYLGDDKYNVFDRLENKK